MSGWNISKQKPIRTGCRYLITGLDDNKLPAWYMLEVATVRCPIFEKAVKSPPVDLEHYGTIIDSGYGQPPDDLEEQLSA